MSCEHMICAHCAGPVVEGRCAACREAKAHVHHSQPGFGVPLLIVAAIAMILLMLALHVGH